jgi:hypothetical protein
MFRQGMGDETLTESGWLHLLEHLCLHGRGGGALQVNGSVSVLSTEFSAHGPTELVSQHLSQVTGWLATPDLRDLRREQDVLRAEARLRTGPAPRAFGWRYGAQGPGLVSYDEPGLGRVTEPTLTERANRVFTTGNAVLALDGPPPAGLRLHLPPGPMLPAGEAVPCDDGMAAYVDEGGVVLSGVITRSDAATVVPEILRRALKERLRDHAGGAYAPWSNYERVDGRHALVLAGSDVAPALLPRLAGLVLDLVERFTSDPVPQGWLDEIIAERLQAYADPHMVAMVAWRAASMWLVGDRPEDLAELVENTRNLDPEAVRADLVDFSDSLLLGIPGETIWRDQLPMLTFPTTSARPQGRRWRHRDWPANASILSVDARGAAVSQGDSTQAMALGNVAGMYCFPDGARHLVGRDGWSLAVEPDRWRRGRGAVELLDTTVPAELHLPQPARTGVTPFKPAAWPVRWWRFLAANATVRYSLLIVAIVAGLVTYGYLTTLRGEGEVAGGSFPGGAAIGLLVLVVALIASRSSRK